MDKKIKTNLLWGTYTWIVFHWLAEHVKEAEFKNERDTIINHIYAICNNLPCPNCQSHAMAYLKANSMSVIKTKGDFKIYLYHFHNSVNKQTKKKYEDYTILNKYKFTNRSLMFHLWNKYYTMGNSINNNDFMAKKKINEVKRMFLAYINTNHYKFLTI